MGAAAPVVEFIAFWRAFQYGGSCCSCAGAVGVDVGGHCTLSSLQGSAGLAWSLGTGVRRLELDTRIKKNRMASKAAHMSIFEGIASFIY